MKQPSRARAMKMKCKRCMADYVDGRVDCEIAKCPLYFWQPYRKLEPELEWMEKKELTEAQKVALKKLQEKGMATRIGKRTSE